MSDKSFTPAAGFPALTPLYDSAVSILTREETWRSALLKEISPSPDDRILDVGCGTGSLILRMKLICPTADIHGIDPDENILQRAKRKLSKKSLEAIFHQGFLNAQSSTELGYFSKVTSSLVFHQTPIEEKSNIIKSIKSMLKPGGKIFIADYGKQRSMAMKMLFRSTIQLLDGLNDTQPNAEGCIPLMLVEAGFDEVVESLVVATVTGSISIYSGIARDDRVGT